MVDFNAAARGKRIAFYAEGAIPGSLAQFRLNERSGAELLYFSNLLNGTPRIFLVRRY